MRRSPSPLLALLAALAMGLGAAACGSSEGDTASAADTLTRRQKDSLISTMPIPGAGAVGRALDARDAANARTEAHDTVR